MLLPYGSQDGLRGSSLKACFQSGTQMPSYPHIGLQRKGCQIFAEGGRKGFLVCVRRVEVGQRSGLSETGRRPMEDIQKDVEFRIMPSGDGGWYWEVRQHR